MKRRIFLLSSILLATMPLVIGCAGDGLEKPEPYEYTHTTELKKFEVYETERIRDAERTVVMTLEQLGYSDLELAGGEEVESPAIEYTLPDDATQGPDKWYIIDFHFLIEFEEDTGGGFCEVRASPLGSVELETQKVNAAPFIRVGGQSVTSTRLDIHYYNYMGLSDVKPGKNEMSFSYKEYQGAKVKKVTIYKDTGISVTATAPSEYDKGLKVTDEEKEKSREIAFRDARIQELAEGKEYTMRITRAEGLIRLASDPPDDDIEVRLVFKGTYMIEDIEASALDIFVDINEEAVTYVFPLGTSGLPELTASAREKAVNIALGDAGVQQELAGKPYQVGKAGLSMGGPVGRLGANVRFVFDAPYLLERPAPSAPERQQTGVKVFVNLKEARVVDILPDTGPLDIEPQLLPPEVNK